MSDQLGSHTMWRHNLRTYALVIRRELEALEELRGAGARAAGRRGRARHNSGVQQKRRVPAVRVLRHRHRTRTGLRLWNRRQMRLRRRRRPAVRGGGRRHCDIWRVDSRVPLAGAGELELRVHELPGAFQHFLVLWIQYFTIPRKTREHLIPIGSK